MAEHMNGKIAISEELICLDLECSSSEETIRKLSRLLIDRGDVRSAFPEEVLNREKVMPTGIQTKAYGIAIPHTDPQHTNNSAIAVAVLRDPVPFFQMETPEEQIDVKVVFLLAIGADKSPTMILASLCDFFQDEEVLQELLTCRTSKQAARFLRQVLTHGKL